MGPPASSGDATTGKAKKVKSEELVSSHGVLDASSVFQNAIAVKTLSDDLLFGRPAEAVVTLCRYDGSYVVVKRDHLAGSDTADMEAIYHKLLAMPALECFLKPLAFEFDYARSQVRTVWPLIGTPSTVCLDLIRFVMPSGKPQDVVPLSVDELAMFVVDMSDALNALHDAGIRRSAVEPANIFVEFQVATRSTPRSVRRFVLADNRRERLFSVPEAADRLAVIDVLSPRRRDAVKTRSDVYDFGACLLWLITKNSSLAYLDDTPPSAALARFIGLAQACMHPDVPSRPSLRQLLDLVSEASPHT